jgi:hypothetical protein
MKVPEFQRTLDVSTIAYYDFMKMSGAMRGESSSVYERAQTFFARREIMKVKGDKKTGGEGREEGGGEGPANKKAKTELPVNDAK